MDEDYLSEVNAEENTLLSYDVMETQNNTTRLL